MVRGTVRGWERGKVAERYTLPGKQRAWRYGFKSLDLLRDLVRREPQCKNP